MQMIVQLHKQEVLYTLQKSRRAQRMRIAVSYDGNVAVTLPGYAQDSLAERFLKQKARWVLNKLEYFQRLRKNTLPLYTYGGYLRNKDCAYEFVARKVEEYNTWYKYSVKKISVKNQKMRWGSCSRKGNLNFNYKIAFLSEQLADYIVVHELCHLQELNHSQKFWNLVAQYFRIIDKFGINSVARR